jgi:flavin reductase (DIM6/NTAB) family NADH-FMN oxidoreductase RutF
MLKVVAEDPGDFYQHYPRAAAIVTVNSEGRKNAMAVAWHCPVSFKPPIYGIAVSPKRFTYNMVVQSRHFAINFMPFEKIEMIAALGGSSGSFTDKFTEFNLAEDQPVKFDVPILRDAYASYECAVIDIRVFGDHAWIIGEILATHVAENLLKDNGVLDLALVNPALYLGGDTYCSTAGNTMKHLDREKLGRGKQSP